MLDVVSILASAGVEEKADDGPIADDVAMAEGGDDGVIYMSRPFHAARNCSDSVYTRLTMDDRFHGGTLTADSFSG